ncbi:hypothetical protein AB0M80_20970 [Amycolatopsis sp. NPDC051045]|uniref:hypothetical protein n=1 Tax=Amycolatopsis sp. NPDC051045 TaxID=3156922 RepID=UPI00341B644F
MIIRSVAAALTAAVVSTSPAGWEAVPVQSGPANLVAMTAPSAHDVWAAGFGIRQEVVDGRPAITFAPQVQHWNGTKWSAVPTPPLGADVVGRFQAIAAAGGRVWAVGDAWEQRGGRHRSLIEQGNGLTWSRVPADDVADADQTLFGVTAVSATDAWAVGSAAYADHTDPVAQHWDGVRWTRVPLPAGLGDAALSAVAADGPGAVWAVGFAAGDSGLAEPLLLRWDGIAWSRVALPATTDRGLARLNAVTVSHGQVWAVGSSTVGGAMNRKPLVFRVDSRGAVLEGTPDEQGQLNAVTTVGREAWAVGYQYDEAAKPHAYALRRGPDGDWRRAPVPEGTGATLYGLTAVAGTLWTAGAMDGAEPGLPGPLVARLC